MHRIRLHGPWMVRLVKTSKLPDETSKDLACDQDRSENCRASAGIESEAAPAGCETDPLYQQALEPSFEQTIQLPSDWDHWQRSNPLGVDQAYELRRAFGRPTGLLPGQKVWLVLTGRCTVQLWLNESRLISDMSQDGTVDQQRRCAEKESKSVGEFRFAIASQLLARNRLRVVIENEEFDQPSSLHSIFLEIDERET